MKVSGPGRFLVLFVCLAMLPAACASPAAGQQAAAPRPAPLSMPGIAAVERADIIPPPPPIVPARPPARFAIPKLGVDASVEQVEFLGVPRNPGNVAWFRTGPAPGEDGDAVIDGHVDWTTGPAVFWRLRELGPGDSIVVTGQGGSKLEFKVDHVDVVNAYSTPPAWLYAKEGSPQLSLITCAGTYTTGGYDHRLLVHSVLAGAL